MGIQSLSRVYARLLSILLMLAFCNPTPAAGQGPPALQRDLQKLLNSPPNGSLQSVQLLGGDLKDGLGPSAFYRAVDPGTSAEATFSVRRITDQYQATRR